jgi:hypothetical protein
MSHFAKINWHDNKMKTGTVTNIIVAEQDFINSGKVGDSFLWVQTSYNNNFRKQYASINGTFDAENNVFIAPKPFNSWVLDGNFDWQPPVSYPDDGQLYSWNEETKTWDLIND